MPDPAPEPAKEDFPWWLTVRNPRRSPPVPKLVHGYPTREEAEAERVARQAAANAQAAAETAARRGLIESHVRVTLERETRAGRAGPALDAWAAAERARAAELVWPPFTFAVTPRPA